MKLRKAIITDLPQILEIINDAILNTTAIYEYEIKSISELENWYQNKLNNEEPVIVVCYGRKVVGYGTFGKFRPRIGYKNTIEHSVYVAKEYQGKGVGKLLLEKLIAIAKERGFHTMIGGIDAANKGSIVFHKKFGFKEVGRLNEVGFKFNKWLDVVYMQLHLSK